MPPKRLSREDYRRSRLFLWEPPVERSPENYQLLSYYDSQRTGRRTYEDYKELPKPDLMDIDGGEPVHTPQDKIGYGAIDRDGDELLVDVNDGPKRVHWTPQEGDKRPRSAGSDPIAPGNRKASLASRIDAYNQVTEADGGECPAPPCAEDFDADISFENLNVASHAVNTPSAKPYYQRVLERERINRIHEVRMQHIERHGQHFPRHSSQFSYNQLALSLNKSFSSSQETSTPDQAFRLRRAATPFASPQEESPLSPSQIFPPKESPPKTSLERKFSTPKIRLSPSQRSPPGPQPQDLYPSLQNVSPQVHYPPTPPPEQDDRGVVRIIRGTVGNIFAYIPAVFGTLWGLFSGGRRFAKPQEIVAVETAPGSGKRRAIALEDLEKNLLAATGGSAFPGYYPAPSPSAAAPNSKSAVKMSTPPDSRPQSQSPQQEAMKKGVESEVQPRSKSRSVQETGPVINKTSTQELRRKPFWEVTSPSESEREPAEARHIESLFGRDEPYQAPPERKPLTATAKAPKQSFEYANSRKAREQRRDKDIDDLIQKTKRAVISTPSVRVQRLRTKKERDREREAKKEEEEAEAAAKVEAEADAEEARKRAEREEEEARERAEQEALAQAAELAARKAAKVLIPPLSPELEDQIAAAMATTNPHAVLATTDLGVELKRYDFGCILPQTGENVIKQGGKSAPSGWLNDEGVNGFLSAIVSRKLAVTGYVKGPKNVPAFACYDAAWYKNFKDKGPKGIQTWSRRKGIKGEKLLDCQRIFFPINTGAHWMLLVIKAKDRTIEFLDSAGGSRKQYFNIARQWLEMELGELYNADEWIESSARSKLQLNMDDCGVFTCINALASAKEYDYEDVEATDKMTGARKAIVSVLLNGGFEGVLEL